MQKTKLAMLATAAILLGAGHAAAAGDAEAGKKVFNKCAACHSIEAGKNKVGPSLFGIFGRKAGTEPSYNYSEVMKNSGLTWDEATLNTYLENPQGMVKGSKMAFVGIKDSVERANLIAYLQTLK
ncbi:MAG: cytochrome c family protein [Rhodospirillales bacterium]